MTKLAEISVNDLKEGMVITAYSRFSDRYKSMDSPTCTFVRHNFKNTRAIVTRNYRKIAIPISKLKPGDTLNKISHFPPDLKKLTVVSSKRFIQELVKRGMLGFQVRQDESIDSRSERELQEILKMVDFPVDKPQRKNLTVKQEYRQKLARIANGLVQKVQQSVEIREKATNSIQHTMDSLRKGSLNINEIKYYVKHITKSSSADALTALAGLNEGDHTYTHCIDVGAIYQVAYFKIIKKIAAKSVFNSKEQALLGAFLHDIGKSKIPKELLDSTEHFEKNSRSIQILRSHSTFGAELLARMNQPNSIINMARLHHVKMNTDMLSSYPVGIDFKDVMFETRLLSIIDIYQALVGKREYKKSWSPPATMRYLDALAGIEYDNRIWDHFLQLMGIYPKGSLVQLSDNSLAFVMNVPERKQDLERPLVAIVQNGDGDRLQHHDLLDLKVEKDISIVRDIGSKEAFGDEALDVFTSIKPV